MDSWAQAQFDTAREHGHSRWSVGRVAWPAATSSLEEPTRMAIEIVHLSSVVNSALVDRRGDRLGRVADVIVRLSDAPHPPLTGIVVRIARRELFVPIDRVAELKPGRVELVGDQLSLQRFERRAGELLLAR